MNASPGILRGHSMASDPVRAVAELAAAITQPVPALVVFFCSNAYDLDAVAREMHAHFGAVPTVGATSAGEIGPAGYLERSLVGASFPGGEFTAVAGILSALQDFDAAAADDLVQRLLQALESRAPAADGTNSFALELIDGLSIREEPVMHALQSALGRIPLVGGSAAGDPERDGARVYFDGRFHDDAAVVALVTTATPFQLFTTQHFATTPHRAVVTRADPARRVVHELDGRPAAGEYARLVGAPRDGLSPEVTARSPVVVRVGGFDYVRSIMTVHDDDDLTFHCAIEEGLVLRVAHAGDLLADLERTLGRLSSDLGPPRAVLAFDCIQRAVEATALGLRERVGAALTAHRALGFSTFGEQFRGMHVNQTLSGIAFGASGGRR